VLSREELVVSPFNNSGRRFRRLRHVVFPLKLSDFPLKKNWCPCVLIFYVQTVLGTSLHRADIVSSEESASLLREETVSGQERAIEVSCFLHTCLMHMFPSKTRKNPGVSAQVVPKFTLISMCIFSP
jgi:hypothetical protein